MQALARALADYDLDLIQIIAGQWEIKLLATDRKAAAEELAEAIARPEIAQDCWARLTADEQNALIDLLVNEGRIPYFHFTRRYGEIRPMGPARREREKPWLEPENITEALYYRGLIVRMFENTPAGAQEYMVIPGDLRDLLPAPTAERVKTPPGYAVAPPRRLSSAFPIAPDDAATLLSYLRLRQINAREWLANAPSEVIDRHLRRPEIAYRAMLAQLLYDLSLIADEELLTQVVTQVNRDAARPWLEAPRSHQIRSLAETWASSLAWNELAFTHGLEADQWSNDPRLARRALLDALHDVPVEIWWSVNSLVDHIKRTNPDFQRPGGDYRSWFLRDTDSGEIMHGFEYWDSIEGAMLRFMIEGPLAWMGLIRTGRGAFMLTEAGLALLERAEWPALPDPTPHVRVDEQGVISVPVDVSRYDRLQIGRFAAWISAPPVSVGSRDDGVYQYRLTPQAIQRSAADGITMTHIISFLQRASGQGLPNNVVKMLNQWQEAPSEVVVEDVVILRAKDLSVYERLRKNERASKWLGDPVGPQAHVVARENLPALMNALRQMGILPLFEGHEKDDWP